MVTIKQIILDLDVVEFIGNDNVVINEIIQLDPENKREDVLYWSNDKNLARFSTCAKGTILCSPYLRKEGKLNPDCNYIVVANPRLAFSKIITNHFVPKVKEMVVSKHASIHPTAKLGKNVFIGDFTVIEEGCEIGDNCYIGYNNTIHSHTKIAHNVKIGSNNTIGGIGFGYEKDEQGDYVLLPHIGNVVIKSNAEIGNNVCIDRAVLGSTLIHENVKIDNLVHVAHGVSIGKNSLIIANSMLGGSSVIGENVWVAPSTSIINKIEIGDNALVGMGAVVVKSVGEKEIVVGNPAKPLKK